MKQRHSILDVTPITALTRALAVSLCLSLVLTTPGTTAWADNNSETSVRLLRNGAAAPDQNSAIGSPMVIGADGKPTVVYNAVLPDYNPNGSEGAFEAAAGNATTGLVSNEARFVATGSNLKSTYGMAFMVQSHPVSVAHVVVSGTQQSPIATATGISSYATVQELQQTQNLPEIRAQLKRIDDDFTDADHVELRKANILVQTADDNAFQENQEVLQDQTQTLNSAMSQLKGRIADADASLGNNATAFQANMTIAESAYGEAQAAYDKVNQTLTSIRELEGDVLTRMQKEIDLAKSLDPNNTEFIQDLEKQKAEVTQSYEAYISKYIKDNLTPVTNALKDSLNQINRLKNGQHMTVTANGIPPLSERIAKSWRPLTSAVVKTLLSAAAGVATTATITTFSAGIGTPLAASAGFAVSASFMKASGAMNDWQEGLGTLFGTTATAKANLDKATSQLGQYKGEEGNLRSGIVGQSQLDLQNVGITGAQARMYGAQMQPANALYTQTLLQKAYDGSGKAQRQELYTAADKMYDMLHGIAGDRAKVHDMANGGSITEDPRAITQRISKAFGNMDQQYKASQDNGVIQLNNWLGNKQDGALTSAHIMTRDEIDASKAGNVSLGMNPKVMALNRYQSAVTGFVQADAMYNGALGAYQQLQASGQDSFFMKPFNITVGAASSVVSFAEAAFGETESGLGRLLNVDSMVSGGKAISLAASNDFASNPFMQMVHHLEGSVPDENALLASYGLSGATFDDTKNEWVVNGKPIDPALQGLLRAVHNKLTTGADADFTYWNKQTNAALGNVTPGIDIAQTVQKVGGVGQLAEAYTNEANSAWGTVGRAAISSLAHETLSTYVTMRGLGNTTELLNEFSEANPLVWAASKYNTAVGMGVQAQFVGGIGDSLSSMFSDTAGLGEKASATAKMFGTVFGMTGAHYESQLDAFKSMQIEQEIESSVVKPAKPTFAAALGQQTFGLALQTGLMSLGGMAGDVGGFVGVMAGAHLSESLSPILTARASAINDAFTSLSESVDDFKLSRAGLLRWTDGAADLSLADTQAAGRQLAATSFINNQLDGLNNDALTALANHESIDTSAFANQRMTVGDMMDYASQKFFGSKDAQGQPIDRSIYTLDGSNSYISELADAKLQARQTADDNSIFNKLKGAFGLQTIGSTADGGLEMPIPETTTRRSSDIERSGSGEPDSNGTPGAGRPDSPLNPSFYSDPAAALRGAEAARKKASDELAAAPKSEEKQKAYEKATSDEQALITEYSRIRGLVDYKSVSLRNLIPFTHALGVSDDQKGHDLKTQQQTLDQSIDLQQALLEAKNDATKADMTAAAKAEVAARVEKITAQLTGKDAGTISDLTLKHGTAALTLKDEQIAAQRADAKVLQDKAIREPESSNAQAEARTAQESLLKLISERANIDHAIRDTAATRRAAVQSQGALDLFRSQNDLTDAVKENTAAQDRLKTANNLGAMVDDAIKSAKHEPQTAETYKAQVQADVAAKLAAGDVKPGDIEQTVQKALADRMKAKTAPEKAENSQTRLGHAMDSLQSQADVTKARTNEASLRVERDAAVTNLDTKGAEKLTDQLGIAESITKTAELKLSSTELHQSKVIQAAEFAAAKADVNKAIENATNAVETKNKETIAKRLAEAEGTLNRARGLVTGKGSTAGDADFVGQRMAQIKLQLETNEKYDVTQHINSIQESLKRLTKRVDAEKAVADSARTVASAKLKLLTAQHAPDEGLGRVEQYRAVRNAKAGMKEAIKGANLQTLASGEVSYKALTGKQKALKDAIEKAGDSNAPISYTFDGISTTYESVAAAREVADAMKYYADALDNALRSNTWDLAAQIKRLQSIDNSGASVVSLIEGKTKLDEDAASKSADIKHPELASAVSKILTEEIEFLKAAAADKPLDEIRKTSSAAALEFKKTVDAIFTKTGEYDRAVDVAKKAAEVAKGDPRYWYRTAEAREAFKQELFGRPKVNEAEALAMAELLMRDPTVSSKSADREGNLGGLNPDQIRMVLENFHGNIATLAMGGGKTYVYSVVLGMHAAMGEDINAHIVVSNNQEISKFVESDLVDKATGELMLDNKGRPVRQGVYRNLMQGMGIDHIFNAADEFEAGKGDHYRSLAEKLTPQKGNVVGVFDLNTYGHAARAVKGAGEELLRNAMVNQVTDKVVDEADAGALLAQSFNVGAPKPATVSLKRDVIELHQMLTRLNVRYEPFREDFDMHDRQKMAYTVDREGNIVYTDAVYDAIDGRRAPGSHSFYTAHDITEVLRGVHDAVNNKVALDNKGELSKTDEMGDSWGTKDQSDFYSIAAHAALDAIHHGDADGLGHIDPATFARQRINLTSHGSEATISEAFTEIGGRKVRKAAGSGTFAGAEAIGMAVYGNKAVAAVEDVSYATFEKGTEVKEGDKEYGYRSHILSTTPDGTRMIREYKNGTFEKAVPLSEYVAKKAIEAQDVDGRGYLSIFESRDSLKQSVEEYIRQRITDAKGEDQAAASTELDQILKDSVNNHRLSREKFAQDQTKHEQSILDRLDGATSPLLKKIASQIEILDRSTDPNMREDGIARPTGSKKLATFAEKVSGRALDFQGNINFFREKPGNRGDFLQELGRTGRIGRVGAKSRWDTERNAAFDVQDIHKNAMLYQRMVDRAKAEGWSAMQQQLEKVGSDYLQLAYKAASHPENLTHDELYTLTQRDADFQLLQKGSGAARFRLSSEPVTKLAKEPLGVIVSGLEEGSQAYKILVGGYKNDKGDDVLSIEQKLKGGHYSVSRNTYDKNDFKSPQQIGKELFRNGLQQAEAMWREIAGNKELLALVPGLEVEARARLLDIAETRGQLNAIFAETSTGPRKAFADVDPTRTHIARDVAEVSRGLVDQILPSESSTSSMTDTRVVAEARHIIDRLNRPDGGAVSTSELGRLAVMAQQAVASNPTLKNSLTHSLSILPTNQPTLILDALAPYLTVPRDSIKIQSNAGVGAIAQRVRNFTADYQQTRAAGAGRFGALGNTVNQLFANGIATQNQIVNAARQWMMAQANGRSMVSQGLVEAALNAQVEANPGTVLRALSQSTVESIVKRAGVLAEARDPALKTSVEQAVRGKLQEVRRAAAISPSLNPETSKGYVAQHAVAGDPTSPVILSVGTVVDPSGVRRTTLASGLRTSQLIDSAVEKKQKLFVKLPKGLADDDSFVTTVQSLAWQANAAAGQPLVFIHRAGERDALAPGTTTREAVPSTGFHPVQGVKTWVAQRFGENAKEQGAIFELGKAFEAHTRLQNIEAEIQKMPNEGIGQQVRASLDFKADAARDAMNNHLGQLLLSAPYFNQLAQKGLIRFHADETANNALLQLVSNLAKASTANDLQAARQALDAYQEIMIGAVRHGHEAVEATQIADLRAEVQKLTNEANGFITVRQAFASPMQALTASLPVATVVIGILAAAATLLAIGGATSITLGVLSYAVMAIPLYPMLKSMSANKGAQGIRGVKAAFSAGSAGKITSGMSFKAKFAWGVVLMVGLLGVSSLTPGVAVAALATKLGVLKLAFYAFSLGNVADFARAAYHHARKVNSFAERALTPVLSASPSALSEDSSQTPSLWSRLMTRVPGVLRRPARVASIAVGVPAFAATAATLPDGAHTFAMVSQHASNMDPTYLAISVVVLAGIGLLAHPKTRALIVNPAVYLWNA